MRKLVYATMPSADGLEQPADLYRVIASLKVMHQREEQVLRQGKEWLRREYQAGRVGHDQGISPADAAVHLASHLDDAMRLAAQLERALNAAHNASAHLTGVEP